jgi:hypothetical protein
MCKSCKRHRPFRRGSKLQFQRKERENSHSGETHILERGFLKAPVPSLEQRLDATSHAKRSFWKQACAPGARLRHPFGALTPHWVRTLATLVDPEALCEGRAGEFVIKYEC